MSKFYHVLFTNFNEIFIVGVNSTTDKDAPLQESPAMFILTLTFTWSS